MRNYVSTFPVAFSLFVALQVLDAGTTLVGLRLGAQEASPFIRGLIGGMGALPGLVTSKAIAFVLAAVSVAAHRPRVLRITNVWFGGLVAWNLFMISRLI